MPKLAVGDLIVVALDMTQSTTPMVLADMLPEGIHNQVRAQAAVRVALDSLFTPMNIIEGMGEIHRQLRLDYEIDLPFLSVHCLYLVRGYLGEDNIAALLHAFRLSMPKVPLLLLDYRRSSEGTYGCVLIGHRALQHLAGTNYNE